jgi:hypothetical protein
MRRALSLCLALSFPLSVYAQESPATAPALTPAPAPAEAPALPKKNPGLALLLSGGGVAASVACFGLSLGSGSVFLARLGSGLLVLGPSAGHVYTGDYQRAAIMSGVRAAAFGGSLLGLSIQNDGFLNQNGGKAALGNTMLTTSTIALISLAFFDIVDAPFSIERLTRKRKEGFTLKLGPAPVTSPDGTTALGLAAAGSF